jgi:ABC-type amino acid transport substrate-binding protein
MIRSLAVIITFAIFLPFSVSAMSVEDAAKKLQEITWYTEEYPPYNYADENGVPTGMTVDILLAAFKKINADITASDLKITSWNRSYKYVQERPGTALFSMTYTPEREELVTFVGPAMPLTISVIAPKSKNIDVKRPLGLRQLKIGAVKNDIGDQLITKQLKDKTAIRRVTSAEQLYLMLNDDKVDVVVYSVDVFNNVIKKSGGDTNLYEDVLVLNEGKIG